MLDITRCHHIASLQTLICFALFLMSTARIATAQTYIGLAISGAFKMGIHTAVSRNDPFTSHEADMRRRVFWTITKLDIYASSCLGLPPMSNPLESDMVSQHNIDQVITDVREGNPIHSGKEALPLMCAARHLELTLITAKINQTLYLSPEVAPRKSKLRTLKVSRAKIHKLEIEILEWRKRTAELLDREMDSIRAKM